MTSDMFAPEIQSYIHWLGNMEHHGVGSQFLFDEKSHVHLDDLFKTLQSLDSVNDNGVYELWLRANRGRLEDLEISRNTVTRARWNPMPNLNNYGCQNSLTKQSGITSLRSRIH